MGFEPTRAEHIGLAVQRLNHSATSSDLHGKGANYNTSHKSWNICVIFPFPNVDLGITVVLLFQNTRGSTLGKERGKLKWERRCQEWM